MAVYKIFPSKDASIYSEEPQMNTGLDAMNEVRNIQSLITGSKTVDGNSVASVVSRFLIEFNQSDIDYVFDNIVQNSQNKVELRSYVATAEGIGQNSKLEVFPLAQSWVNGTGQYLDSPIIKDGASWAKRSATSKWTSGSFSTYQTASYFPTEVGGGVWYTGSTDPNLVLPSTQSFDIKTTKDLKVDVTNIVKTWYSESKGVNPYTSISNNGFIVKWTGSLEYNPDINVSPDLKFYSSDTYTIYPPELDIKWTDYDFSTGSRSIISTPELFMSLDENPGVFYSDSINRFRVNCRPKYPIRVYQTGSIYTENFLLPSSSYYAIKDLDTNEYVIDFDDTYTQISADGDSSYFTVYMNGLEPERYYQVLIKTTVNNQVIVYKDNNFNFKIKNG